MIRFVAPVRAPDAHGSGAYNAPRGSRKHKGVDFAAWPDSACLALVKGTVTKLGYPYADDLSYRYVEITDNGGFRGRYFYLDPAVELGDIVDCRTVIGHVQPLQDRYPEITPHVHFEIMDPDGNYLNPSNYAQTHKLL